MDANQAQPNANIFGFGDSTQEIKDYNGNHSHLIPKEWNCAKKGKRKRTLS